MVFPPGPFEPCVGRVLVLTIPDGLLLSMFLQSTSMLCQHGFPTLQYFLDMGNAFLVHPRSRLINEKQPRPWFKVKESLATLSFGPHTIGSMRVLGPNVTSSFLLVGLAVLARTMLLHRPSSPIDLSTTLAILLDPETL